MLLYNLHECNLTKASLIKDLAKASLTKVKIKKVVMTKNKRNTNDIK